jgi:UDP-N-acetylmuramoyl-tripeptide--D-alanyl-D-alanine ligase
LLSIPDDTGIAIIEMGANHQKEIAMLASICKPTHGLITNVGLAHLEGFGGFEGVKKGKGELYDFLKKSNGVTFINHDNHELVQMSRERALERVVFYGTGADNYVSGKPESSEPFISMEWLKQDMEVDALPELAQSNLTGSYNAENILAAITIGTFFKLSPGQINRGISDYVPQNNRSQLSKTAHNILICDYYNANPSSMDAALSNFSKMEAGKKVVILGDMFELGDHSEAEHRLIVEKALALNAWKTLFVGRHFFNVKTEGALFFEDTASVSDWLDRNPISQATILVKGSRGMALEKLVGKL